jgi:microcystin-dependent protein
MPLNKLDNFLKNTEGRILYVNPSDLDASDSIDNQGNSLARPFKTIQRAIIEAARFSYVRGNNNDIIEKTTILLFPGEHIVDNRPGWAIYDNGGVAYAVPRTGGVGTPAVSTLSLTLDSNFDLTQEDNILYKFNSYYGGVVVPRGISLVGLDLRKTKIRPKYVPNPTDPNVGKSAIFRLTGTCYFWQFSFFDGDDTGTVYTNPNLFSGEYQSTPLFSHHKLTCFEYADGVNDIENYGLTDLDMYYSKLSNAFNVYREIIDKFPEAPDGFAKRTPEWEIVGAFASDPIDIVDAISGNGSTATSRITVTTSRAHNLNVGTPIKIRGIATANYNISTKVQEVINDTQFTYLLPSFPINLNANPSVSGATVIVETDTVTGASPYVFNCSLRSVWGMNGMHADGSKASGFKSMIVAQFTGVSLQKDDRAFVKYDKPTRTYNGVPITTVYGSALPSGASQTDASRIYHLDSEAIYRRGWETSHIKISNDAFIQVVSVFAIGFNKHFDAETGGDFSITNSNSNFGQIALNSSGFRKEAFEKDDKAFVTSIIPPRAVNTNVQEDIDWLPIDVGLTTSVGISTHLYLFGFNAETSVAPASVAQGFKIGARSNDNLFVTLNGTEYGARILMDDVTTSSAKTYAVSGAPSSNIFTIGSHTIQTGEKVIITSDNGDLPENINPHTVYYAIRHSSTAVKLASSRRNAQIGDEITVYGGQQLRISSRVTDKESGEIGSPIQFNSTVGNWYITVQGGNAIYNALNSLGGVASLGESTDLAYVKRVNDERSLDEKIYKLRVVIPKEAVNSKNPEPGFVIQESSSTGARSDSDFVLTSITANDFDYQRNPRFISTCTVAANVVTVIAERPHNLQVGEIVVVKNVQSTTNTIGLDNLGYNGTFEITAVPDDMTFRYSIIDVNGISHSVGNCINNTSNRTISSLGRFERSDNQSNIYIYRSEVISEYIQGTQDGIYHVYALNASNAVPEEFTNIEYSQSPVDLYPQLDRDNVNDNPPSAATFAKRAPIGDVVTNDLKSSITRETVDKFMRASGSALKISTVSSSTSSATITFDRRHGLSGLISGTVAGGSGYTNGTYYNVRLFNNVGLTDWRGALATVVVSGGVVSSATITSPGSGYSSGTLYFDTVIGSGTGASLAITTAGISTNVGDVVQFTGAGTTSDTYHRITSVGSATQVSVAKTAGDPTITNSQYAFVVGPSVRISSTSYNATTGVLTVNCSSSHGLLSGNRFRILDSSNNNRGDYLVQNVNSVTQFTAYTGLSITATNGYIFKHGLSSNDAVSDVTEENFGIRNTPIYANEVLRLTTAITNETTSSFSISSPVGISTSQRFPLGSYIQIDNEIMRITSNSNNSTVSVIRGVLGTRPETHLVNSLIRKIKPIPVEFRRPSILRASGHTFEYLGYGPGNYSTALPQIQVKTLTDRESFLVQAQERTCGIVVYNGINNNGDVFAGNTKTLSSSGEIVSFDIPKPTVTGQSVSALTAVFDEVTIKQKLLVEGGSSGTLLSQFDGPVTFNREVRIKGNLTLGADSVFKITNPDIPASVSGDLFVGDALTVGGNSTLSGEVTVNTGIVPDTDEGAYLGSASRPFSEAWVGEIGIATGTTDAEDRTIRSVTGNLTLSATTGNSVAISTNASVTGDLNVTGKISAAFLDVPNVAPIGSIVMWPSASAPPTNWRICNGALLSQTTYSELYALIGNNYNTGGETAGNFRIPNLTGRFVIGSNATYPLTGINSTGGAATVTLQIAQIPSHTHTHTMDSAGDHTHGGTNQGGNHTHQMQGAGGHSHGGATNPGGIHGHGGATSAAGGHSHSTGPAGAHTHSYTWRVDTAFRGAPQAQANAQVANSPSGSSGTGPAGAHTHPISTEPNHSHEISQSPAHTHPITAELDHTHTIVAAPQHVHPITSDGSHVHDLTINSIGGSGAHENLPPYRALNYIIRII